MLLRGNLPSALMLSLVLMCASLTQGRGEDPINPRRFLDDAADACETMFAANRGSSSSDEVVTTPSEAEACFDLIPFDLEHDLGILDSVVKSIQTYYVFALQVESNPDPLLPGGYPLLGMLADLRARAVAGTFSSGRKFHEALDKIIRRANDKNLVYITGCFANTMYKLPLVLIGYRNSTGHHVVEVADQTNFYHFVATDALSFDFNVSEYVGAQVLTIGGEAPQQHLEKLGTELGHAQPRGARYNDLLASPHAGWYRDVWLSIGDFAYRDLSPGRDTLTVELHRSDWPAKRTVVVPWLAYTPSHIVNSTALLEDCTRGSCWGDTFFLTPSQGIKIGLGEEQAHKEWHRGGRAFRSQSTGKPFSFAIDLERLPVHDFASVLLLPDGVTAVIPVLDFLGPWDGIEQPVFEAIKGALREILADGRAKRLLLDVRKNTAGNFLEARLLAALLMGSASFPRPNWFPRAQMGAGSPLVEKLVRKGVGSFDGRSYQNPNQIPYEELSDYFLPVRQQRYSVRQKVGNYSKFFKPANVSDPFRNYFREGGLQPLGLPIAILTDGLCASACGLFLSTMSQELKVPVVMVTSLNAPSQSILHSVGGLKALASNEICSITWDAEDEYDTPQRFTNGTDLYVSMVQMFVPSTERLPADFKHYPSTVQIFHTQETATNLTALWIAAAKAVWG